MKKVKIIYELGKQAFAKPMQDYGYEYYVNEYILDWFLKLSPAVSKINILEFFEYVIFACIPDNKFYESDDIFWFPFSENHNYDNFNEAKPSFESDYISIIGELFLSEYVDFYNEDSGYLSEYKNSRYEAWKYFRDNFIYKYSFENYSNELYENNKDGYSSLLSSTSWDKPQDWSQYNILVARTPKGEKYFNEVLAPKFYEKYKDIEITLDDEGNII
ncbi:hypothetical protein [Campylobacter sp. CCUG 57310]|uniref:hypothetical protein n=1 Tax=Campylobacter sp. CCUG 57310 TaxID=2517362 RepID=UPI001566A0D7|nr:hypothetical protein [Campylobacter sp. CCUG 57310]QKF91475.1 hypothetical protein CORI_0242 [Campylobacter sp. CCUG 57310]